MQIDPRLNGIDDCLYRVGVRAVIFQDNKILLVREVSDHWWAFPGGGVAYGESVEQTLSREIEEELGVPAEVISSDFQIVHYDIGNVVNAVPRMNLFFRVSLPAESLKKTNHVARWRWFTREQFLDLDLHASFDKAKLSSIIFGARERT